MTRKRIHDITIATEGQQQLLDVLRGETLTALGERLDIDPRRLDEWRSGRARPWGPNARRLDHALGIPVGAWDTPVGETVPMTMASHDEQPPVPQLSDDPTTEEQVLARLAVLRRVPGGLTDAEARRRVAEHRALLAVLARLDRERIHADEIVTTHAGWRRAKGLLVSALADHPDALRAVHVALAEIGEWGPTVEQLDPARAPTTATPLGELVDELLRQLRPTGAVEDEPAWRAAERTKLLALKGRVERAERLMVDAIVRAPHPRWRRIRTVISETLRTHPAALAAVVDALGSWSALEAGVAAVDDDGDDE
ncbi:MAG: helix-turn-helix transcriptional regulator [Deltaproteobacteria bacterium]|nr:helix-turn-helix transcriptional regulator [Deltaproteobacteria bacterium]